MTSSAPPSTAPAMISSAAASTPSPTLTIQITASPNSSTVDSLITQVISAVAQQPTNLTSLDLTLITVTNSTPSLIVVESTTASPTTIRPRRISIV
jgi:hypothetical protein